MVKWMPVLLYLVALVGFALVVRTLLRRKWFGKENLPENSLVIIVRNKQEIIEGILRKTLQMRNEKAENLELIIIDTGSTDETPKIISRFSRQRGGLMFINAVGSTEMQELVDIGLEISRGEKIYYFTIKENMTYNDIHNSLDEIITKKPQQYFLPREKFR